MKVRYSASSQANPDTPPKAADAVTSPARVAYEPNCSRTPAVSSPCIEKCIASSHHHTASNRFNRLPSRSAAIGSAQRMSARQSKGTGTRRRCVLSHHRAGRAIRPTG